MYSRYGYYSSGRFPDSDYQRPEQEEDESDSEEEEEDEEEEEEEEDDDEEEDGQGAGDGRRRGGGGKGGGGRRRENAALIRALQPPDEGLVAREEAEFKKMEEEVAKRRAEQRAKEQAMEETSELPGAAPRPVMDPETVRMAVEVAEGAATAEGEGEGTGLTAAAAAALAAAARESSVGTGKGAALATSIMRERAKFIPLRLTYEERPMLRLVTGTVAVSEYTNAVDQPFASTAKRRHAQLQQVCALLSGMVTSQNYGSGQHVVSSRSFRKHSSMLRKHLEVARRYKIMNPEKMRGEYGKLIYFLQDAVGADVAPLLNIDVNLPVKTVYSMLEERDGGAALRVLDDPRIETATREILPDKNKSRGQIQSEIKQKERAIEDLARRYSTRELSPDDIRTCLYSICDNNSFLNSNRLPIDRMIALLKKYFHPNREERDYSLAIAEGQDGARLTHSHEHQYNFVLQSLTLWREIVGDMFRLWYLAEQDMLDTDQPYELTDTGQGWQRIQQSPRVYKAMHEILYVTQQRLGGNWVGSSVIHLGDRNVPNTLMFIDKYAQVVRILGPMVTVINMLETLGREDAGVQRYLNFYGGYDKACKDILHDFFKHAFDGSGGDNFFDAGSCIDGRLTSAWNWCSQLSQKPYYPLFRLAGFNGFDGEFQS